MSEKAAKKRKPEQSTDVKVNKERAIELGLWFDDGNIVLIAQCMPFKVHRGFLIQRSEVFRDMCSLPEVPEGSETQVDMMDGVPIVHMSDHWEDVSDLLSALYYSQRLLGVGSNVPFPIASALLRMANKYGIKDLEDDIVARLKLMFPSTLKEFDKIYRPCDRADKRYTSSQAHMKLHARDAIVAINLARTFNIPCILPSAFYICSRLPIDILVTGVPNPRGSRYLLSKADQTRCFQGILELSRRYVLKLETLHHEIGTGDCDDVGACEERAQERAEEDRRENDDIHSLNALGNCLARSTTVRSEVDEEGLCDTCISRMEELRDDFRDDTWSALKRIFNLDKG